MIGERRRKRQFKELQEILIETDNDSQDVPDVPLVVRQLRISVSQFVSQMWCETQLHYSISGHSKKTSSRAIFAIQAGLERHAELERENVNQTLIQRWSDCWKVASREDLVAFRLVDSILRVRELVKGQAGGVREVWIWGKLPEFLACGWKVWVFGLIDEIKVKGLEEKHKTFYLSETKTRQNPILPRFDQRKGSRLQLQLYRYLLGRLTANSCGETACEEFLRFQRIDSHKDLSETMQLRIKDFLGDNVASLNELVLLYMQEFTNLDHSLSQTLEVVYEHQTTQKLLARDVFLFNERSVENDLSNFLKYWIGEREPTFVGPDERWKCRSCPHFHVCESSPMKYGQSIKTDT